MRNIVRHLQYLFVGILLATAAPMASADVLKVMCLGDSNTRGTYPVDEAGPHSASIGAGGYRYPLQQMLRNGGYSFDFVGSQTSNAVGEQGNNPPATWTYDSTFDPDHQGLAGFGNAQLVTGGTVPAYAGDPIKDAPSLVNCLSMYQPGIVLLMSGTNGLTATNIAANLTSLNAIISTITATSPSTHIIVSTIYDRYDSTAMHDATDAYNAGIPGLVTTAQKRGELVTFVDCGAALTEADFAGYGGVHPNPLSLSKVAEVWYAGIQSVPEPKTFTMLLGVAFLSCGKLLLRFRSHSTIKGSMPCTSAIDKVSR